MLQLMQINYISCLLFSMNNMQKENTFQDKGKTMEQESVDSFDLYVNREREVLGFFFRFREKIYLIRSNVVYIGQKRPVKFTLQAILYT